MRLCHSARIPAAALHGRQACHQRGAQREPCATARRDSAEAEVEMNASTLITTMPSQYVTPSRIFLSLEPETPRKPGAKDGRVGGASARALSRPTFAQQRGKCPERDPSQRSSTPPPTRAVTPTAAVREVQRSSDQASRGARCLPSCSRREDQRCQDDRTYSLERSESDDDMSERSFARPQTDTLRAAPPA